MLKQDLREVKEKYPNIYQMVFHKQFSNVERFEDYRFILLAFAYSLASAPKIEKYEQIEQLTIVDRVLQFEKFSKYNYPFFFVSPEMVEALENTSIENITIDPATVHLPYESFCFVFPKGGVDLQGKPLRFLFTNRIQAQEYSETFGEKIEFQGGVKTNLNIEAVFPNNQSLVRGLSEVTNLDTSEIEINRLLSDYNDFNEKDTYRLQVAADWTFKLLFAMSAKPELVSGGGRRSKPKKKGTTWFDPIVVGKKYTYKNTSGIENSEPSHSKRLHWRRGHFRQQPYGSFELEERPIKVIWIEPMLINASKGAEV